MVALALSMLVAVVLLTLEPLEPLPASASTDEFSAERAFLVLARKHPFLHGLLIPLVHRLRGNETMYIELTPIES